MSLNRPEGGGMAHCKEYKGLLDHPVVHLPWNHWGTPLLHLPDDPVVPTEGSSLG